MIQPAASSPAMKKAASQSPRHMNPSAVHEEALGHVRKVKGLLQRVTEDTDARLGRHGLTIDKVVHHDNILGRRIVVGSKSTIAAGDPHACDYRLAEDYS